MHTRPSAVSLGLSATKPFSFCFKPKLFSFKPKPFTFDQNSFSYELKPFSFQPSHSLSNHSHSVSNQSHSVSNQRYSVLNQSHSVSNQCHSAPASIRLSRARARPSQKSSVVSPVERQRQLKTAVTDCLRPRSQLSQQPPIARQLSALAEQLRLADTPSYITAHFPTATQWTIRVGVNKTQSACQE